MGDTDTLDLDPRSFSTRLDEIEFESLNNNRPFMKVKMAISNDEKIAWPDYSSKWISNSKSREYSHKIRFHSQAILTTSKTILKDNPRFTVRKKNKIIKFLPVIIIDKFLKIPLNCNLFKNLSKRNTLIVDGSHNPLGASVIKKYLEDQMVHKKIYIIAGMMNNKNHKEYFSFFKNIAQSIIVIDIPNQKNSIKKEKTQLNSIQDNKIFTKN